MKSFGVTRKLDDLGRYTIPCEIRQELGLKHLTLTEVYTEGEYIVMKVYEGGITMNRPIDSLGRIVIPMEIRRKLKIIDGVSSLECFAEDNKLYLKKYVSGCIFCGEIAIDNHNYKNNIICSKCAKEIGEL